MDFCFSQIEGSVLDKVAIDAKVRTGDPFLVDLQVSELRIRLSREQLTLLLDVMNENFAGMGYTPNAIQLPEVDHTLSTGTTLTTTAGRGASFPSTLEKNVVELLGEINLRA